MPLIGGVVGGGVDAVTTGVVGEVARRTFAPDEPAAQPGAGRGGRVGALAARGLAPLKRLTSRRATEVHREDGQPVLGDTAPELSVLTACIGWNTITADPDLDASAFLCRRNGKVGSDDDFVFFNNVASPDGAVRLDPAALADADADEHAKAAFSIDVPAIPANIRKIVFALSRYGSDEGQPTFGHLDGAFLSVVDQTEDIEIVRYDLPDTYTADAAVVIGELARSRDGWQFRPIDEGYPGGLAAVAERYGVEVDQTP